MTTPLTSTFLSTFGTSHPGQLTILNHSVNTHMTIRSGRGNLSRKN